MYLWRAVDGEGEVLDMLVQRRRDTRSALRLIRKLLKKQGFVPKLLVTDKLCSYASAFRRLRLTCRHEQGLRRNRGEGRKVGNRCCPAASRVINEWEHCPQGQPRRWGREPARMGGEQYSPVRPEKSLHQARTALRGWVTIVPDDALKTISAQTR